MTRILITSAVPGFRRAGIEHPARKVYEPGELTAEQLDALRAEPNLTVVAIGAADEVGTTDGRHALTELRQAVGAAIEAGVSLAAFTVAIADFIGREWTTQAHNFQAPQQAQDASGQQAEPEAEPVDKVDGEAAQASGSEVTSLPDEAKSLPVPTPETGEAEGVGAAAAAPAADKPAKAPRKAK